MQYYTGAKFEAASYNSGTNASTPAKLAGVAALLGCLLSTNNDRWAVRAMGAPELGPPSSRGELLENSAFLCAALHNRGAIEPRLITPPRVIGATVGAKRVHQHVRVFGGSCQRRFRCPSGRSSPVRGHRIMSMGIDSPSDRKGIGWEKA